MPTASPDDIQHGSRTVGTTAVRLTNSVIKPKNGVQIYASDNNAGTVYVGIGSDITANGGDETTGYPLQADQAVLVPCRVAKEVYVIADQASQQVFWIGT